MVGLRGLEQIAHRMEDVLDRLFDGTLARDPSVMALLIATNDAIADIVCGSGLTAPFESRLRDLYERYDTLASSVPAAEPRASRYGADPDARRDVAKRERTH